MNVGIIGAGAMGSGIAQVASTAGCQVKLFDVSKGTLTNSEQKLKKILDRLVEKGRIDERKSLEIQQNISYSENIHAFSDCDLIIEAIVENLDIKKKVFSQIEEIVGKECVISTNTSSLSVTSLGAALKHPKRFLGIHFFNPAPLMKLVEIIPAVQTDPSITEHIKKTIDSWGKTTVLAKDTPGFIVNKVARPFYSEALRIYEEGIADIPTIDFAMKEVGGFRMGPFTLMDFIGHDVNYSVTESVFKAFYYNGRYTPSFAQKRLVEAGYLGKKSGKGFYDYSAESKQNHPVQDQELLQYIVERIVAMLINEAVDTLHFGIASKEDIDMAMTRGVNYPKGLLAWADELGIQTCVDRMDVLFDEYHEERYRCSPLLRKMAKKGEAFFDLKHA